MKKAIQLTCLVALWVIHPAPSFAQSQESLLAGYRYAVVPLQTFSNGKVDPYGLGRRLRARISADASWKVLTDIDLTLKASANALWPTELSWQTVAASESIAQDRNKLAQTASLQVSTLGGRGRIEVTVVVSDLLGREVGQFKGASGRFGDVSGRMLDALDQAIDLLFKARPQFNRELSRTAATQKVEIDETQMRSYLATAPQLSPVEGIWSDRDGTFRIAIKREEGTAQFVALVLSSKHPFWDTGMVKARFEPTADPDTLIGHYRRDDLEEQTVPFRIESASLVSQKSLGLDVRFVRLDTGEVRPAAPAPQVATATTPAPPGVTAPGKAQVGPLRRIGTGTAFVVGENLVATNFHVIDGGTAWELRFPSTNEGWPLEVVVADKANDLVVMRMKGAAPLLKPLNVVAARSARLGEEIFTVGFPLAGLLSDGHKVATGIISGMAGLDNDPRFFQLTVPTQPGNSGGPIFNSKGEVVGILASTLSVEYLYKVAKTIPQNVNFAIKSDYLLLLLAQAEAGISPTKVGSSAASRVDQIADAQGSIGLVSTFAERDTRDTTLEASRRQSVDGPAAPDTPALAVAYRHTQGPRLLVKQQGANATITFYRTDSSVYGNGSVSWNAAAGGFVGFVEIAYRCGSVDTRVTTIQGGLELFLESAGTIRLRAQIASGINCSQNRSTLTWGEDRWYP
jgi:S1-C subfamily serine protease